MGDIINATADLFGIGPASKQADAVEQAANIGAGSSAAATAAQERMTERQIAAQQTALNQQLAAQKDAMERQIALQEPWRQAGQTALNQLAPLAANYQKFGMDQFTQDPGYAFRLSEGQKALDRSAAARGGMISGGALKAAQRYGQEMGSQEYTNAFNRYQTERASQLQPLQSLAGVGQSATNQMGSAAGAYGSGASNAYGAAGAGASGAYGNLGTNLGNLALGAGATAGNAAIAQGNIRASQYGTAGSAANTLWNNRNTISNWWNSNPDPYVASRTNAINSGYSEYDA